MAGAQGAVALDADGPTGPGWVATGQRGSALGSEP